MHCGRQYRALFAGIQGIIDEEASGGLESIGECEGGSAGQRQVAAAAMIDSCIVIGIGRGGLSYLVTGNNKGIARGLYLGTKAGAF